MHLDKKTIKYIFWCVIGCIAFYWVLNEFERVRSVWDFVSGIFAPFVVGAALAFVFNVPMRAIEQLLEEVRSDRARRGLALILTLVALLLVLVGIVLLLVPQIQRTVEDIVAQVPGFISDVQTFVLKFLEDQPELAAWVQEYLTKLTIDWKSLIEKVADWASKSLASLLDSAVSAVGSLAGAIFNAVVSFVFAIYCLSQKETLARQGRKLLYAIVSEERGDEVVRVLRMTNSAFSNFITGQCLEAVILALLFVIAMMIFRMPYIPLISVLIGVTALVPLVGAFVGCILGAFFILVNDPFQAVTFVIMFLVIQQFEGNVIYPKVVGKSIGLPGMWVLLAVAAGGELMGVGGMLIMVPFASVLYALLQEFANSRLAEKHLDPEKLQPQPPEVRSGLRRRHKGKKPFALKIKRKTQEEKSE